MRGAGVVNAFCLLPRKVLPRQELRTLGNRSLSSTVSCGLGKERVFSCRMREHVIATLIGNSTPTLPVYFRMDLALHYLLLPPPPSSSSS